VVFVLAFHHFLLAFGRFKSGLKSKKLRSSRKLLLTSHFWDYPMFDLSKANEKNEKKTGNKHLLITSRIYMRGGVVLDRLPLCLSCI
jgi:hypothetical protein